MYTNGNYVITGVNSKGVRFKPIYTTTPQHYNIYNGNIWKILPNGKRKHIRTITN